VRLRIYDTYEQVSAAAADIVEHTIRRRPDAVLGLPTGSLPIGLYQELVRRHREKDLDFSRVVTFNLDEYLGLGEDHPQGYHRYMAERLFDHINILRANTHIPSGSAPDYVEHCTWYEGHIVEHGGIDVQFLGIGGDGHIGFNEPGTSLRSRTSVQTLTPQTLRDNSRFFAKFEDVPVHAVTMGVATILEARRIVVIASGTAKADAVARAVEGPLCSMVTASALQLHTDTTWLLDREAAGNLRARALFEWMAEVEAKDPGGPAAVLPR
jgi:glucosamine-6-phosphate deaminase